MASIEKLREAWQRQLVAAQDELGPRTALMGIAISWHLNRETGLAFPSVSTLAALTKVTGRTVLRSIAKLVAAGHVTRTQMRRGGPNHYKPILAGGSDKALSPPMPAVDAPGSDKALSPGSDKALSGGWCHSSVTLTSELTSDEPPIGAVASATRLAVDEDFEKFWKAYPRRDGANPKAPAKLKFQAAIRKGAKPSAIIAAAEAYAHAEATKDRVGTPYIAQAQTWFNQRRWEDHAAQTTETAPVATKVFVPVDTPQWEAWSNIRKWPEQDFKIDGHYRRGWWFESEWPPDHKPNGEGAQNGAAPLN